LTFDCLNLKLTCHTIVKALQLLHAYSEPLSLKLAFLH